LNRVSSLNKILRTLSQLEQKYQREPSLDEIADASGLAAGEVESNLSNSGRHLSMDAPFAQGEEGTLLDVLADRDSETPDVKLMTDSLRTEIQRALSTLTVREAEVISFYFGLNGNSPLTLEELGEKFDLTRERVRQIKEKATRRLRTASRSSILKNYL
jgi:RNA polymerase primary sigma factor